MRNRVGSDRVAPDRVAARGVAARASGGGVDWRSADDGSGSDDRRRVGAVGNAERNATVRARYAVEHGSARRGLRQCRGPGRRITRHDDALRRLINLGHVLPHSVEPLGEPVTAQDHHGIDIGRIHRRTQQIGARPTFAGLHLFQYRSNGNAARPHPAPAGADDEGAGFERRSERNSAQLDQIPARRRSREMRLRDPECGPVGRHRTDAEIRMRPQHGVAHRGIHLIDHADQAFRSDHGAQSAHASARAGAENHGGLVPYAAAVQGFSRYETPAKRGAEPDDFSQAVILALERASFHRVEREAVDAGLLEISQEQRLAAPLGSFLEHHERSKEGPPYSSRDGIAHRVRKSTGRERQDNADSQNDKVEPGVASDGAGQLLPQVARTDQYFASSSSIRPQPRTTQVRGSSSTWIGRPVSWDNRTSRPRMRAPPPVITMPRSTMSAALSFAASM